MEIHEFYIPSSSGLANLHCMEWIPNGEVKAVVQIAHGMMEHVRRVCRRPAAEGELCRAAARGGSWKKDGRVRRGGACAEIGRSARLCHGANEP